jgi:hypothetical protein
MPNERKTITNNELWRFCRFGAGKKQNQKLAFGRESEILSPKSETDRTEVERQIPARFT